MNGPGEIMDDETDDSRLLVTTQGSLGDDRSRLWYRNTPLIILTAFSGFAGFLFGYDTGNISGALPYIEDELLVSFKSSPSRLHLVEGFIVTGAVIGAAVASATGGALSDRLGRKAALKLADLFFLAGSLTMAFSHSASLLIIGRVLLGLGIGLASVTAPVYIGETAPASIRATLVTFNTLMITFGQLAAYFLSYLFTFTAATWRWMVGIAAVPAVIQIIGLAFLPESPRWLQMKGRNQEATRVLATLGQSAEALPGNERAPSQSKSLQEVLSSTILRKELHLGIGLQVWQQLLGINTIMYYTPVLLRSAGITDNRTALLLAMGPAAVNALGTVLGMYLVDLIGRRKLLLGSIAGIIVALLLLGTSFKLSDSHTVVVTQSSCSVTNATTCAACIQGGCTFCPAQDTHQGICIEAVENCPAFFSPRDDVSQSRTTLMRTVGNETDSIVERSAGGDEGSCPDPYFIWIMVAVILYLAAFSPGMGPVPWCVNAEIFPAEVRGLANGAAATANWVTNAIVSQLFLALADSIGAGGVFLVIACLAVLGCAWVYKLLPETKGLTLEQIQGLFSGQSGEETEAM